MKKILVFLSILISISVHKAYSCHKNTHLEFMKLDTKDKIRAIGEIQRQALNYRYPIEPITYTEEQKKELYNRIENCKNMGVFFKNIGETKRLQINNDNTAHIMKKIKISCDQPIEIKVPSTGLTNAIVTLLTKQDKQSFIVLKSYEFKNDEERLEGIKELANSILATQIVQGYDDKEIKLARVIEAVRDGESFDCLSVIFEGALGQDIHKTLLETDNEKEIINSTAVFLARFHKAAYIKHFPNKSLKDFKNRYYIRFEKNFRDFLNFKDLKNKYLVETLNSIQEDTKFRHRDVKELILKDLQTCLTSFRNDIIDVQTGVSIMPTHTHGDAHGGNLFFNTSIENLKCHEKLTMIDYETITETYINMGNPAQDVGRFVGSLWLEAAKRLLSSKNKSFKQELENTILLQRDYK